MVELIYTGPASLVFSDPPLGSLVPDELVAVDEDHVERLLATGHFACVEAQPAPEPVTKIAKPTATKAAPQED